MKVALSLCLFLLGSIVEAKVLHLGKVDIPVYEVKPGVWVSDHCQKECKALKAVELYRSTPQKPDGNLRGKNPWSFRCIHRAGGKAVLLRDENKNQVTYCVFEDGSLVNTKAFE